MKKILVIGCPGSGKSTLSKELQKILGFDILHLDYIYHIDNDNQISRDELKMKINEFTEQRESYIIDGNYSGTLEMRLKSADTVFFYMIDSQTCVSNAIKRLSEPHRDDMAPGFDNSKMDDDFLDYIRDFNTMSIPRIEKILNEFDHIEVIRLYSYEDANNVLESLR
jgi:adenylate kinase family enzyme